MSLLQLDAPMDSQELESLERLLAEEVTQGLGPMELEELHYLLGRATGRGDSVPAEGLDGVASSEASEAILDELHLAAAVAELALLHDTAQRTADRAADPMPAFVESNLRRLADEESKRVRSGQSVSPDDTRFYRPGLSPAWWIAAAALFLAFLAWWPRLDGRTTVHEPPPRMVSTDPTPVPQVETFDPSDPAVVSLPFQPTEDESSVGASGTMLWSPEKQRGEMRITGLEANDPGEFQYQLWIFDAERDERYPVDGGVFDVPAEGNAVIPVDPRVPVSEATLFAITVEPPGGVVVSDRERIALVAQPS